MILRWCDAGDLGGEPGYTRAEIHDARRPTDRHAYPMPMGCGDEPATKVSETACNRCNHGRPLGEHPCPRCGCPEYRMLIRLEG